MQSYLRKKGARKRKRQWTIKGKIRRKLRTTNKINRCIAIHFGASKKAEINRDSFRNRRGRHNQRIKCDTRNWITAILRNQ